MYSKQSGPKWTGVVNVEPLRDRRGQLQAVSAVNFLQWKFHAVLTLKNLTFHGSGWHGMAWAEINAGDSSSFLGEGGPTNTSKVFVGVTTTPSTEQIPPLPWVGEGFISGGRSTFWLRFVLDFRFVGRCW